FADTRAVEWRAVTNRGARPQAFARLHRIDVEHPCRLGHCNVYGFSARFRQTSGHRRGPISYLNINSHRLGERDDIGSKGVLLSLDLLDKAARLQGPL